MKLFKRIAGIMLAVVLAMGLTTTAFADSGNSADDKGSITISNAVSGQTYTAYQLFELESFSDDGDTETTDDAYSYKIATESPWYGFVTGSGAGVSYVSVDDNGYVTWKEANADAAAFAKAALEYAKTNNIGGTSVTASSTTVEFTDLALGYYLVDSSLGALCSLDTTNLTAEIEEKNAEPTVTKEVQEGDSWSDNNTAKIGDTVNFKATITAKAGAENYVLHDVMSDGLTFNGANSVAIEGLTKGTDYTVVTGDLEDSCTFHVVFDQFYLNTITGQTEIVVTYTATLNKNAVIADTGNTNKVQLTYGDNTLDTNDSAWDTTRTYTYEFDLVKTDKDAKVLSGATFKLYDAQTDGNEIAVVKNADGTYRVAVEGETGVAIEAGIATIQGLDSSTYWLEEIAAPDGYNMLAERVEVTIDGANNKAKLSADSASWEKGGVQVINQTGTILPSTGGMGTTIFYIVGGIFLVGAAVVIVTRKRMGVSE